MKQIAMILFAAVALSACSDEDVHFHRSRAYTTCHNGTVIGYDYVSGAYTWTNGNAFGDLGRGVTVEQFCRGAG